MLPTEFIKSNTIRAYIIIIIDRYLIDRVNHKFEYLILIIGTSITMADTADVGLRLRNYIIKLYSYTYIFIGRILVYWNLKLWYLYIFAVINWNQTVSNIDGRYIIWKDSGIIYSTECWSLPDRGWRERDVISTFRWSECFCRVRCEEGHVVSVDGHAQ